MLCSVAVPEWWDLGLSQLAVHSLLIALDDLCRIGANNLVGAHFYRYGPLSVFTQSQTRNS